VERLTSLRLRNFKSWRDTGELRLAPITALFGTNSSGKTSLLQSLLLMRQTTESPDRKRVLEMGGPGSLVDLGTAQDVQFGHDASNNVSLEVSWQERASVVLQDPLARAQKLASRLYDSDKLSLATELEIDRASISVRRTDYGLGEARVSMVRRQEDVGYDLESSSNSSGTLDGHGTFQLRRTSTDFPIRSGSISRMLPFSAISNFSSSKGSLESAILGPSETIRAGSTCFRAACPVTLADEASSQSTPWWPLVCEGHW
jgi:hypothetical protein